MFEYRISDPLHGEYLWFLGAFDKLRKATISFVMTVRLSVTTRLPLERFFTKFGIYVFFENLSRKFRLR